MKCSAETSGIYVCERRKEVLLVGDHACWAFGFLLALVLRVLRSWHHSSHRERPRAAGAHASLALARFNHYLLHCEQQPLSELHGQFGGAVPLPSSCGSRRGALRHLNEKANKVQERCMLDAQYASNKQIQHSKLLELTLYVCSQTQDTCALKQPSQWRRVM